MMNAAITLICFWIMFVFDSPGLSLRGTVVDNTGKPIAGARVDIATAAPRFGPALFCPSCYRDCKKTTKTDEHGRFEIDGLDGTLKFTVLASSPSTRAQQTKLIDPLQGDVRITLQPLPTDIPAERIVLVELVNDRGQPITGALAEPVGGKTAERHWGGLTSGVDSTVSDAQGFLSMPVPKGFLGLDVQVVAQGYSGAFYPLLKPGTTRHRLVVPSGTRVTGRLVLNGRPLAGSRIAVVQTDRGAGRNFIKAVGATTDAEGKFAFDQLPANEEYAIFTPVGDGPQNQAMSTKRFKVLGDRQPRDLGDLSAIAPLRISGKLELREGQSLTVGSKIIVGRDPAWDLISVPVAKDGSFAIEGLPPETYTLHVAAKGFELDGARMPYQTVEKDTFGLRLRESIEGLRIAQKQGD